MQRKLVLSALYYSITVPLTERDLESPDPLRLSREIGEVAARVRRYRRRLVEGSATHDDPFFVGRLVAGKSAFTAMQSLGRDDPLRRPLERWIYRLAEQRINRGAIVEVVRERHHVEHVVTEPERMKVTLSSIVERALAEPVRRAAWLSSYVRAAEPLGSAVASLWERRAEVASRMGVGNPDSIESPNAGVVAAAEQWLVRTADRFFDVCDTPSRFWDIALAAGATEGWPRHIVPRLVSDLFRETDLLRGLELDPGPLPGAVAPASFPRALARIGAAWVDATAPSDQPFVVAHDPYGLRRRTMGALFGALPAARAFAARALGLDASRIAAHRRALFGAILTESRAAALRVLLRRSALEGRSTFRESFEGRVAETFCLSMPPYAAGSLWRPRIDTAQRFAGILLASEEARRLRDAHDEDWYRNPRAVEELRDEARRSPDPSTTDDALARGADALHAALADAFR